MDANSPEAELRRLLDIMAALRAPARRLSVGLAADLRDDRARTRSRKPTRWRMPSCGATSASLPDELGDLLFQVVYHARMAEEAGHFAFADVARAIADKMIRRHPHVFGDAAARDAAEQIGCLGGAEDGGADGQGRGRGTGGRAVGPPCPVPRGQAHVARGPRRLRLAQC